MPEQGDALGSSVSAVVLLVVFHHPRHIVPGTKNDRNTGADPGLYIEDALSSCRTGTTSLFNNEGHGIGFIYKTELALATFGLHLLVQGVHEYTATGQDSMDLADHGGDPTHIEVLAPGTGGAGRALVHITLNGCFPMTHIGGVDGKFLHLFWEVILG